MGRCCGTCVGIEGLKAGSCCDRIGCSNSCALKREHFRKALGSDCIEAACKVSLVLIILNVILMYFLMRIFHLEAFFFDLILSLWS